MQRIVPQVVAAEGCGDVALLFGEASEGEFDPDSPGVGAADDSPELAGDAFVLEDERNGFGGAEKSRRLMGKLSLFAFIDWVFHT